MQSLCLVTEKVMAPHSSTLAWKIPWTEESVRLQSMGSLGQTRLSDFTFTFHDTQKGRRRVSEQEEHLIISAF